MKKSEKPFYAEGLRFSCLRCSVCCRHEPGFVFLSGADITLLAKSVTMGYNEFVQAYCRWVLIPGEGERLSLREKAGFDCVFWKNGCTVYESRPLQCRAFPFWESALRSLGAWKRLDCPGVGKGTLCSREYIETLLERQKAEPLLIRGLE